MIQEQYVSFEIAKLLKEKGFYIPCYTIYNPVNTANSVSHLYVKQSNTSFKEAPIYSAPTQSLVLRWLREVHHYYIQVMLDSWAWGGHTGYYVVIQKTDSEFEMMLQDAVDEIFYETYEEACEAAIKYCLENF